MISLTNNKQLVLFDGVCNLCNDSVTFIINNDKENVFVFASLQSTIGKTIIEEFKIDTSKTDSILLYKNKKLHLKASAALLIASRLTFPYNTLSLFRIVPSFISNIVYDFIAKNRYKWFGKKEYCMVPKPHLKEKFLE